jgi:hypothetical protein
MAPSAPLREPVNNPCRRRAPREAKARFAGWLGVFSLCAQTSSSIDRRCNILNKP